MKVLVLGSGGREHALVWKLSQDKSCSEVMVWPGNPGMKEAKRISMPFSKENLLTFLKSEQIDLVIPGPEKFSYDGVTNWCREAGVLCFAPDEHAAVLERSKLISKEVMTSARIPTAAYKDLTVSFYHSIEATKEILREFRTPVIKISGPSLGKGVFVCKSADEAYATLLEIKKHPMAGIEEGIFVEEGLEGDEISLFYACNGSEFLYLGAAQDHKRLLDNDLGPNTGGMGTVSPVSWATPEFLSYVTKNFLRPTLAEMGKRGTPFTGVLFLGLMVKEGKANLLEYNVRFGDPETQVILPLIEGDFALAIHSLLSGKKGEVTVSKRAAVHIVKAAKGYPGLFGAPIEKGKKIENHLASDASTLLFMAGVKEENGSLVSDGGRVLGLTALAETKELAREKAYKEISKVGFEGEHYRSDIGVKA